MIKIFLTLILLNTPIHEARQLEKLRKTFVAYASYVNIDLKIHVKSVKDKSCEPLNDWSTVEAYHLCISKTYGGRLFLKPSRMQNTIIEVIKPPFNFWGIKFLGGIANVCSKNQFYGSPIGISSWKADDLKGSEMVAVHELFHQFGAQHNDTPFNVMVTMFTNEIIAKAPLNVEVETYNQIQECLK